MYKEPALDDEFKESLRNGEIYLGGCCYCPAFPEYQCNKCANYIKDDNIVCENLKRVESG